MRVNSPCAGWVWVNDDIGVSLDVARQTLVGWMIGLIYWCSLLSSLLFLGPSGQHLCKRWLGRRGCSALITHQWKWRSHCAFLIMEVVLVDHIRSSVIFTLKNFVVFTNSTAMPLMTGGMCFFLKSTDTSLVMWTLRCRLLMSHQLMSRCISSL